MDQQTNIYNLVYITDRRYLFPTKVSIRSAANSTEGKKIIIWVIGVDLDEKDIEYLSEEQYEYAQIHILTFEDVFSDINTEHRYVSKAALYKFRLGEIFRDLDRILYLDGDILLYDGFLTIFDHDIENCYMAAVRDIQAELILDRAAMMGNPYYFNSGVMYLNLAKIRENDCFSQLIKYKKSDKNSDFMDQDTINKIFGSNALSLKPVYNCMSTMIDHFSLSEIAEFYETDNEDMIRILKNPYCYHMTGPLKPWDNCYTVSAERWLNNLTETEFMNVAKRYFMKIAANTDPKFLNDLKWKAEVAEQSINKHDKHAEYTDNALNSMNERMDFLSERISKLDGFINKINQKVLDMDDYINKINQKVLDMDDYINKINQKVLDMDDYYQKQIIAGQDKPKD